jgi:O-antigen ligase
VLNESQLSKNYHFLLGMSSLLIGAYSKWVLVGLLPLFIFTMYGWYKSIFTFQWKNIQWTWALLYVFYVGYSLAFWQEALTPKQIEYKLSWLIFPFLFALTPMFKLEKKQVIQGYTLGVIIASCLGIAKAIYTCNTIGLTLTSYTSSNICINHPTYFSVSATIALLLWIENWNTSILERWKLWHKMIVIGFLFIMILLSFSMAGFLFIAALMGIGFLYLMIKPRISIKIKALMLALPIIAVILLMQNEFVKGEFSNTLQALNQYVDDPSEFIAEKKQAQNGDEIRLIMWTATFLEAREHPLGVGPTRIGQHLSERLQALQQPDMAKQNAQGEVHYNPHNQYLQMALEIGWLPLILFIYILLSTIRFGIKHHAYVLSAITLLLGFHCFFESILQRQSGIVTFTFFITYLIFCITNEQKRDAQYVG